MSTETYLPYLVRTTWEQQLEILSSSPHEMHCRNILSTMTPDLLFRTALHSEAMFQLISAYLVFLASEAFDDAEFTDEETSDSDDEPHPPEEEAFASDKEASPSPYGQQASQVVSGATGLGDIPPEIALNIIAGVDLMDKVRLGRASRYLGNLAAVALQDDATQLLARFHLRFLDIRFLLCATNSIISGSAVLALLTSPPTFEPGDLDFFTSYGGGGAVVQFLASAAGYKVSSLTGPYDFAKGVAKACTLKRDTGETINVIEGYNANPLETVVRFHSTPVFGAWDCDRIWHGNPQLTTSKIAITTPSQFPLPSTPDLRDRVRAILRKYTDRGFTYSLNEYPHPHVCGIDLRCPATLRSSDDEACLTFNFPQWEFSAYSTPLPHVSWFMGGSGCTHGIRAGSGAPVRNATSLPDAAWKTVMSMFLHLNSIGIDMDYTVY
ncbi:hypothetical protein B0H11DRAFT_2260137 [Mycena galericulata]|nr:hypothetical protein B0H11DRAFT_2260137 [Mycena galericulata]